MENIKKTIIFYLLIILALCCFVFNWKNYEPSNLINVIIETNRKNNDDILIKYNNKYFIPPQFNNVLNQTINEKIDSLEILVNNNFQNKIKSIIIFNNTQMHYFKDFSKCNKSQEKNYIKYKIDNEILISKTTKYSSFINSVKNFDKSFYLAFILLFSSIFFINNTKTTKFILPLFILIFSIIFELNDINLYKPWGDECYSILISDPKLPFLNIFNDPGNPPFYYLILKFYMFIFKNSIFNLRLLSVFFNLLAQILLFKFLYKNYNFKLAIIALFLFSTNLPLIYYSQEIRSYSLQILLSILILIYTFKILKKFKSKDLIIYVILGIFAVNTHYYQTLFILSNFLFISYQFIKNKEKEKFIKFLCINLIIALSFLPFYLYTAHKSALLDINFNTQLPDISFELVKRCIFFIFQGLIPLILSVGFLFNKNLDSKRKNLINYCFWIIFSTITFAIFLSFLIRPMLIERYVLFLIPFALIILAVIFSFEYKNKFLVLFFIPIIFLLQNYSKTSFVNIRLKSTQSYNLFELANEYSNNKKSLLIIKPSDSAIKKLYKFDKFKTITISHTNSYKINTSKINEIKENNKNSIIFTTLLDIEKNALNNKNYTCFFNSSTDLCLWKIE